MKWLVGAVVVWMLLAMAGSAAADGGYTAEQQNVIRLIYERCDYYSQQAGFSLDCRVAFYKAWEETKYGLSLYGDYNTVGVACSRGVYQWFAGWGNNCVGGGAACSGDYYRRFGLGWRENRWLDVDRAVDMLTSAQRGGPNYCSHWRICGAVPAWYVQPARPGFIGGGGGGPMEPEPTPTPRPAARMTAE